MEIRTAHRRTLLWILFFGLCAFALFFNAGGRLLAEPDELRYLEVAREMEERASWVLPLYNYELYLDKGPLYFYLLAGAQHLSGDPFRAALLPAQFCSLLSLLAAFALFRLWGWSDRRTALSLAMLLIMAQFFLMARFCRMDAVLAWLILTGYLALFLRLERGARWTPALFGLCLALGLLTKGPVALLWLWVFPLAWAAWTRDRRVPAFLFHPLSVLTALLPVLAWLLPAHGALGPDLLRVIFIDQTNGRIVQARDHVQPFFYYLYALPAAAFPAAVYALRGLFERPAGRMDGYLRWWLLLPLAFFSLMSGKIIIYLLPLFPAVAGLAGTALDRLPEGPPWLWRWCHFATALPLLLAGATAWAVGGHHRFAEVQGPVQAFAAATAIAGLVLAVWAFWHPRTFVWALAPAVALLYLFPVQTLLREGLPHQTTHALARDYARVAQAQDRGYAYADLRPSYLYHLRKPVEVMTWPSQLVKCLDSGNAVLVRDRVYDLLPRAVKESTVIEEEQELTRRHFYIIKKKP